jgi:nucleotide-binding universal stress UspA family protein
VLGELLPPSFLTIGPTAIRDLHPEILLRTRTDLKKLFDECSPCQGVEVETYALEGHAAREIVRFTQDHTTDLVLMASHGRGGLKHFLLGGTTEKVMAAAECPVLVLKELEE